jgi:hypothetical protein
MVVSLALLAGTFSLVGCGGGSSQQNTTVPPASETVRITSLPCSAAPCPIAVGANWQYAATVTGTSNQSVTWSISPQSAGMIDSTGFFIAPYAVPSPATVTITATSADGSASQSTSVAVQQDDPLGSIAYSVLPSCTGSIQNSTCYQLTVTCPGIADIFAYLKVNNPTGQAPIGTVLFGTGTGGAGLYDDPTSGGYEYGSNIITDVAAAGYNTVQVSFGGPFNPSPAQPNGWLQGPGGVRRLACRYATIADWVYRHPTVINPGVSASTTNSAPMCATGNSGGSAAVVYAAYEYGLATDLNEFTMIEPTSGPVMTRIDLGCSPASSSGNGPICANSSNMASMTYQAGDASVIDEAYQASGATTPTPCTDAINGSAATTGMFLSDSIFYTGTEQSVAFPNLIVNLLYGDLDTSNAVPQGMTWGQLITPSSSSPVTFQCLAGVQHDIPSSPPGSQSGDENIAGDIISLCR